MTIIVAVAFLSFRGIRSDPGALFGLSDFIIAFMSSARASRKSSRHILKKGIFNFYNTGAFPDEFPTIYIYNVLIKHFN